MAPGIVSSREIRRRGDAAALNGAIARGVSVDGTKFLDALADSFDLFRRQSIGLRHVDALFVE